MAERRCTECGRPLGAHARPTQKTCSDSCRSRRSRRIKRKRKKAGEARAHPPELQPIYQADQGKIEDVGMEVMREELRPVVREALTEDVLRAIEDLVNLTPSVVSAIRDDILQTEDKTLRQRAYSLVAKYTLGNASVAPPPPEQQAQGLVVNFNMPRPGDESVPELAPPSDAIEVKKCIECTEEKSSECFVGNSDRCTQCHEELQAKVRERFGGGEE